MPVTHRKPWEECPPEPDDQAEREAEDQRRRFAKALARDAFGRHYWDERMALEVRRAARKRRC